MEKGRVRERMLITIVGAPGTGKTTLVRQLVEQAPGKVLVVDVNGEWPDLPFVNPTRLGLWARGRSRNSPKRARTAPVDDIDQVVRNIIAGVRNALIVLDDMDAYSWHDAKVWRPLFVSYRHYGLDVIAVFHSIQTAHKPAIANASRLVLFAQDPRSQEVLEKMGLAVPGEPFEYYIYDLRKRK